MSKEIKLSDLVNNKNVLLVGNSKTLLDTDYSSLIDSYEFVIRFNLAIKYLHQYKIGNKCDAWIYAMLREQVCKLTYNEATIKPKYCIRYGNITQFDEHTMTLDIDKNEVRETLGIPEEKFPSTGIATVHYLVNKCNCSTLSLIGFDSMINSNFYIRTNRAKVHHCPYKEKTYLNALQSDNKLNIL